jgi:hypothetical protein
MVSYFYAWTPFVIVGTVVLLSLPWLGLIALLTLALVAIVALAALASAIIFVPFRLSRAISRRWQGRNAIPQPMAMSLGERRRR